MLPLECASRHSRRRHRGRRRFSGNKIECGCRREYARRRRLLLHIFRPIFVGTSFVELKTKTLHETMGFCYCFGLQTNRKWHTSG